MDLRRSRPRANIEDQRESFVPPEALLSDVLIPDAEMPDDPRILETIMRDPKITSGSFGTINAGVEEVIKQYMQDRMNQSNKVQALTRTRFPDSLEVPEVSAIEQMLRGMTNGPR